MGDSIFNESDSERKKRGLKPSQLRNVLIGPHRLRGDAATREYWLNGEKLDPADANKVSNHSPDGFCHGYMGSGPSCLALAICLKLIPMDAQNNYHIFKEKIIAKIEFSHHFDIEFVYDREFGWVITDIVKMEKFEQVRRIPYGTW